MASDGAVASRDGVDEVVFFSMVGLSGVLRVRFSASVAMCL